MWEFAQIISSEPFTEICNDVHKLPGAKWFSGSRLNFAENLLRRRDGHIAIKFYGEDQEIGRAHV